MGSGCHNQYCLHNCLGSCLKPGLRDCSRDTAGSEGNVFIRHSILYILSCNRRYGLLRCAWTLTLSVGQRFNLFHPEIIAFPIAMLEVFRRFIWNFFRLENEHLNNCGEFRDCPRHLIQTFGTQIGFILHN